MAHALVQAMEDAERLTADLDREKGPTPAVPVEELLAALREVVELALAQLRATAPSTLDDHRAVGRAGLPSSVQGLLHHAGEHTVRHAAR